MEIVKNTYQETFEIKAIGHDDYLYIYIYNLKKAMD